jgi:hypothetical protein
MLTREWSAAERAQVFPVRSDTPDVRAYALFRSDRKLSVFLINSNPTRSYRYRLETVLGNHRQPLAGKLNVSQYSRRNYVFKAHGPDGHPLRNLPPTTFTASSSEVTLPPLSFGVATTAGELAGAHAPG